MLRRSSRLFQALSFAPRHEFGYFYNCLSGRTSVSITLDDTDRRILTMLQEDGSLTVNELAQRIGMTPPPCWRRVKRLKDAGCLRRQVWLVDAAAVGLEVTLYANIQLTAHDLEATTAFREHVRALPEVIECYLLLGNSDALLKIIVPSIKYYETFFYTRLSQLPGVRAITSSVVMTEIKATTSLPV
ncbi:Lrp/AsnC family transcriptional regulator [Rhodovarius crocodyli]|uniref:Lrp/AsnC family transcriptional regulator n=1 Tax=Rhodovarius crocodyli TaxID=1979269 RepID=A0A437MN87_9PROT|nr:Lrp/AsnC family transcriptional regulator [Rhodovarius crocodyli]